MHYFGCFQTPKKACGKTYIVCKQFMLIGDFWDAWWQQTYQVKFIVLGHARLLRTTQTMESYLVSLLPHSVPKSPNEEVACLRHMLILTCVALSLLEDKFVITRVLVE